MSRIALCVSGQFRKVQFEKTLLAEILENVECDVFVSSWSSIGTTSAFTRLFPLPIIGSIVSDRKSGSENDSIIDLHRNFPNLADLFYSRGSLNAETFPVIGRAVRSEIDDFPSNFDSIRELFGIRLPDAMSQENKRSHYNLPMFYKIWSANKLCADYARRRGEPYSKVVRIRPDIVADDPGKIIDILKDREEMGDRILVPKDVRDHFVNDMFAIGSPRSMEKYASVWANLTDYWNLDAHPSWPPEDRISERLLFSHLKFEKVDVEMLEAKTSVLFEKFKNQDILVALREDLRSGNAPRSCISAINALNCYLWHLKIRAVNDPEAGMKIYSQIMDEFSASRAEMPNYPFPAWALGFATRKAHKPDVSWAFEDIIIEDFSGTWPPPCIDAINWAIEDDRYEKARALFFRVYRNFPGYGPLNELAAKLGIPIKSR